MHCLNLIQIHLLNVRQNAFSNSESGVAGNKRDRILISKVDCDFQISHRNKQIYLLIQFSQIVLVLSKVCQLLIVLNIQRASSP